jgi:hypothetical protein
LLQQECGHCGGEQQGKKQANKEASKQKERQETERNSLGEHNQFLKETKAIAQIQNSKKPLKPKKLPSLSLHFRQVPLPTRYFGYLLIFEYP